MNCDNSEIRWMDAWSSNCIHVVRGSGKFIWLYATQCFSLSVLAHRKVFQCGSWIEEGCDRFQSRVPVD